VRRNIAIAGAVTAVIAGAYASTLWLPFFGDDYGFGLYFVGGKLSLHEVWLGISKGWGGISGAIYWRPLYTIATAMGLAVFGVDPLAFRVQNLLLHVLVCIAVAALLRALAPKVSPIHMVGAALFFGLHPVAPSIATQVINCMSAEATLCYLLSLLSFLRYRATGSRAALVGSLLLVAIAVGFKETGFTLPIVIVAVDGIVSFARVTKTGAGRLRIALLYAGLLCVLLAVRAIALGAMDDRMTRSWLELQNLPQTLRSFATALAMMIVPVNPSAVGAAWPYLSTITVGLVCIMAFLGGPKRIRQSPGHLVAASLVVFPLLITATFPLDARREVYFGVGRFLYLPLTGVTLLLFLPHARNATPRRAHVLSGLLLAGILTATVSRTIAPIRHAANLAQAIAEAARDEARRSSGRWTVLVVLTGEQGIPDLGAWLLFALQPPFASEQYDRIMPTTKFHLDQDASLASLVFDGGVRFSVWDSRQRVFREVRDDRGSTAEAFASDPGSGIPEPHTWSPEAGGTVAELPEGRYALRRSAGIRGGLLSPVLSLPARDLAALEIRTSAAWRVLWRIEPAEEWTRGPVAPGSDKSTVIPLAIDLAWSWSRRQGRAERLQLRLVPEGDSEDVPLPAVVRPLARLPLLKITSWPTRISPTKSFVLPLEPPFPPFAVVHFLTPAMPLSVAAPVVGGRISLDPSALPVLEWIIDARGSTPLLLSVDGLLRKDDPCSIQSRSRIREIDLAGEAIDPRGRRGD
jgi:hypothetical protein